MNRIFPNIRGASLYVALFPCNECAKFIIQAGIQEVVFLDDKYHDTDICRASRILFGMAGVKLRQHTPADVSLKLHLEQIAQNKFGK
jgi:dCMP deaminase